jgi:hypothetical protein
MPVSDAPERWFEILGFPEPIDPDVVYLENMASALFLAPAASRPVGAERPVPVRAASGVGFVRPSRSGLDSIFSAGPRPRMASTRSPSANSRSRT